MKIQLHWQERMPPHRTKFVAEYVGPPVTYETRDAAYACLREVAEHRLAECPPDWWPMILAVPT